MDFQKYYGEDFNAKLIKERIETVVQKFILEECDCPTCMFSSSGRAEILGNHTDHNNGLVLVAAISCDILAAVKKTDDNLVKICSEGFEPFIVDLSDTNFKSCELGTSIALTRGVANALKEKGYTIGGFTAYLTSNIFKGAGVSSSAAFEVLLAEIFNTLYLDKKLTDVEKAVVSQYAENVYFGKPCGLLDQSGIAIGSLSKLDFLDSKNPTIEKFDMLKGYSLVITNTGGDHANLTSHYASIRAEMESVAKFFGKNVLREVDETEFYTNIKQLKEQTSERAVVRAMHFFEENKRVIKASNALKTGNVKEFLDCVNESGLSSLIRLQNCCVPGEVTQTVILGIELSRSIIRDGAVRVHGGGFKGSILAIVNNAEKENYVQKMSDVFGKDNVFTASVRPLGTSIME